MGSELSACVLSLKTGAGKKIEEKKREKNVQALRKCEEYQYFYILSSFIFFFQIHFKHKVMRTITVNKK